MKKTSSTPYPVKRHLIYQDLSSEVLSAIEILSASTVKILAVEQIRFSKRQKKLFADVLRNSYLQKILNIHRKTPVVKSLKTATLLNRDSNPGVFL